MMVRGNSVVLYGKREFNEGDTCSFLQNYDNIHNNVVVDEEELNELLFQAEEDLDLLCLVGF